MELCLPNWSYFDASSIYVIFFFTTQPKKLSLKSVLHDRDLGEKRTRGCVAAPRLTPTRIRQSSYHDSWGTRGTAMWMSRHVIPERHVAIVLLVQLHVLDLDFSLPWIGLDLSFSKTPQAFKAANAKTSGVVEHFTKVVMSSWTFQ